MLQKSAGFTVQDETRLIVLAKLGDDAAFEGLIRQYHPRFKRLAASILNDSSEADDVTQNSYLKAHRRIRQFKGESTFGTWLARIVINQARSLLSYRRRYNLISIDEGTLMQRDGPGELKEFSLDPEHQLATRQIHRILLREINRVPPIFRNVLVLRDLQEMPLAEIASRLNLSEQTVKTRLFRGRKELRLRMLKHCGERERASL